MARSYKFTADGSQLQQEAKKNVTELRTMQGELKKLETQVRVTFKEASLEAKASGASMEQLRHLNQQMAREQLALNNVRKQITSDAESSGRKVIESEDDQKRAIDQVTESLRRQRAEAAKLPTGGSEHIDISARQKSAALVRGGGLRAAESFAATIPGFASIAEFAFPVVGAVSLATEIGHGIEKLHEMRTAALEMGQTLRDSYEGAHSKAVVTIDDLTVQADKLQDNIDKLHGHPGDGLRTALDEARRFADKLRESLAADRKELQSLFKEHEVGTFASLLSGVSPTGKQQKELVQDHKDLESRVDNANATFNSETVNAKSLVDIKAAGKKRDKAITDAIQSTIDTYKREGARLRQEEIDSQRFAAEQVQFSATQGHFAGSAEVKNNSAKISNVDGLAQKYQDLLNTFRAQGRVDELTEENGKAEQQKENARLTKEAGSKSLEAQHKAAEAQRKQWESELAALQANGKATAAAIHQFWIDRENETVAGSENYREAEKHSNEALKVLNTEREKLFDESIKMREAFGRAGMQDVLTAISPGISRNANGALDAARSLADLQTVQRSAALTVAESNVQFELQAGRISKADAALQLQTLHTMAYDQALQKLREQLDAVQDGPEATAQRNGFQSQIVQLDTHRAVEQMQDDAALAAETWKGSMNLAIDQWVQHATDGAAQVREMLESSLSAVNGNLASLATGGHSNFTGMLQGLRQQAFNIGLGRLEAPLLGKLGIGKPDGSAGNPMNVRVLNFGDSASGTAASAITNLFPAGKFGGAATDVLQSALNFVPGGSIIGGLANAMFGGHRALGGKVKAGMTYDIGEMGRERFTPDRDGTITPNNQLGGNVAHYTLHVGEGVTSEQMHQQITSTLKQFHPMVVRDATKAVREQSMRGPNR